MKEEEGDAGTSQLPRRDECCGERRHHSGLGAEISSDSFSFWETYYCQWQEMSQFRYEFMLGTGNLNLLEIYDAFHLRQHFSNIIFYIGWNYCRCVSLNVTDALTH